MPPPLQLGPYNVQVLDLTQPFAPGMPVWPGDPPYQMHPHAALATAGFALNTLQLGEHTGTHLGVPAHLVAGGLTMEQVPVAALVRPGVLIDVSAAAALDPDFVLTPALVLAWEQTHGPIPPHAIVILRTGWERFWGQPAYLGVDAQGVCHFPGFSPAATTYLLETRQAVGLGIDTHGIDAGQDPAFLSNTLLAQHGGLHLENLCQLAALPSQGFLLVVGALPIVGGTGSPARVLALCLESGS